MNEIVLFVLVALSIVAFMLPLILTVIKTEALPTCISECYYCVGEWFTLLFLTGSVLVAPVTLSMTDSGVGFLAPVALGFVGVAPNYEPKGTTERRVHVAAAVVAMMAAVAFTVTVMPHGLVYLAGALVALFDWKRWLLYCELACFAMVYFAISVRLGV